MLLSKASCLDDTLQLSMETKGQWLNDLLEDAGWTPADLARATGLDSAVISNIRNGKLGTGAMQSSRLHRESIPLRTGK